MGENFTRAIEHRHHTASKHTRNQSKKKREREHKEIRQKTRIMTLNVYSINNKQKAIEQYLKANRVHIAIITETFLLEGEKDTVEIKDYTIASTCSRKQGERKGGVAILLHTTIPHTGKEHRITRRKSEMEYCSVTVYPNHNNKDQLVIVGAYRPPDRDHPEYEQAFRNMLFEHRERAKTTIILGDFHINDWETTEKGAYLNWILEEDLWELSDPTIPTYRTGTTTDGVLMALGDYQPEGLFPQEADPELDGDSRRCTRSLSRKCRRRSITMLCSWTSSQWGFRPCLQEGNMQYTA